MNISVSSPIKLPRNHVVPEMNTPPLTPGIPPSEVRIIREKLGNNTLTGNFNNIMFTEGSVDFIQSEGDYRNLSNLAELLLTKDGCVFIDVTGIDPKTRQFVGTFYLYSSVQGVHQQIQSSTEVSISRTLEQQKVSQGGVIAVLNHGSI